MAMNFLEFEQPIAELEAKIEELKFIGSDASVNITEEIKRLQSKSRALTTSIFASLTPWQITELARHPQRPYTLDYVSMIFSDWQELHGDRMYSDDLAIVGGLARIDGMPVMLIGHQKGRDTKERVRRNYGMPKPEGYRKALRLMKMAERFRVPVVTLIDTPGAYPGIGSEERGQSEAIARNMFEMSNLERRHRRGRVRWRACHWSLRLLDHAAVQRVFGHYAGSLRVDFVEEHREERNRCRSDGRHRGTALQAQAGR
jgi:acetyl-CoA carboxylase carboxyl transferase subunit alpha